MRSGTIGEYAASLAGIVVFGVLYWIVDVRWWLAFLLGIATMVAGTMLAKQLDRRG